MTRLSHGTHTARSHVPLPCPQPLHPDVSLHPVCVEGTLPPPHRPPPHRAQAGRWHLIAEMLQTPRARRLRLHAFFSRPPATPRRCEHEKQHHHYPPFPLTPSPGTGEGRWWRVGAGEACGWLGSQPPAPWDTHSPSLPEGEPGRNDSPVLSPKPSCLPSFPSPPRRGGLCLQKGC